MGTGDEERERERERERCSSVNREGQEIVVEKREKVRKENIKGEREREREGKVEGECGGVMWRARRLLPPLHKQTVDQ